MANPTSSFGWIMPTSTDLVTDLPADFEVFGQAVDSDLADLLGGTTGQVLSKTSDTDLAFTWTPAAASSGLTLIQRSTVTAAADTSTTFDGVFTSTYKAYLVVMESEIGRAHV